MHFAPISILSAIALPMMAMAAAEQATSGPSMATGPVTMADFLTSCQTPGQISLTYSEGPSEATMEMLQTLKEAQARVTFFTNATWLQYMQYAGVTRHAYLDGHLIGMTYRLPSDNSAGLTDTDIKEDIGRASRTIQDLIGVYPRYMKIHESNLKDSRLLNLCKSMGYTLVGFNMDEYDYKYNSAASSSQIAEVYNAMFSKQMDAYGRKASYVVAGYDVPTTGAAVALPKVINTINAHGYDMVRLDGCTNERTPYKKDPILNNGFVGDDRSFGAKEYRHGQVNVKTIAYNPSNSHGNNAGAAPMPDGSANKNVAPSHGGTAKVSMGSKMESAVAVVFAIVPAIVYAWL
ncbi:chitin deacetylase [Lunasporangiospora selenospora]|uniref:Chitin deacetylase n=1 Tax=Lunasporangiospora selenospora TaxID=979761 RepID=A0A9P6G000_9FUNG|nr:chitin deacetylase [Lunasporangiospora selenospora]